MTSRQLLVVTLAVLIVCLPTSSLAQVPKGAIAGHAGKQFGPRYADYTVQLRNVSSGQMVGSNVLDQDGKFSFSNLQLNQRYLVEVYQTMPSRLVCTEGPFTLDFYQKKQKTDVVVECGKPPALAWLLVAGAGTAAALSTTTASGSR
jgi:hypothetical protein